MSAPSPDQWTMQDLEQAIENKRRNKIASYYPDTGPLRRDLYPKHLEFFAAGVDHSERLAICANRIGKTEGISCYELTCHATGRYPAWWPGRRFTGPITAWVAGKTAETTRDILQAKLLGATHRDPEGDPKQVLGLGTGMIPADAIVHTTPKGGLPGAIDTAWIRHESGGTSQIGFKSYGKDRDSFEGTEKDVICLDEEPPTEVDDECTMRLAATRPGQANGLKIITFTPLEGYTEVVKKYLESTDPDKWFIQIGWNDAPHITQAEIDRLSKKYLPSQLRARSRGEPTIGEGAIYQLDIEELLIDDQEIPDHWLRGYAMDVGKTGVVWGALNKQTDVLHLVREYYSEIYDTTKHIAAIKGVKDADAWMPGVIDPSSLQSSQIDGRRLYKVYADAGLNLATAENSVETGLDVVWGRMTTGRLKVFRSLNRWRNEYSRYHKIRVETLTGIKSAVVKKDDHLMDATRYLCMSGIARMKTKPRVKPPEHHFFEVGGRGQSNPNQSWMA